MKHIKPSVVHFFNIFLTVHIGIMLVSDQLDAKELLIDLHTGRPLT